MVVVVRVSQVVRGLRSCLVFLALQRDLQVLEALANSIQNNCLHFLKKVELEQELLLHLRFLKKLVLDLELQQY